METTWHHWQLTLPPYSFATLIAPITDPVLIFLIIVAIMLIAPLLFERLRLPGIVGLILAGVIVGPSGLGLLERDSTIILLGTVGLLFLMFMAGLETSLDDLKLNAKAAIIFGLATFTLPMVIGIIAMLLLGYGMLAAVLVASCFASHTLLALPILTKLGIMRAPAVTATLGGTLITNTLALLVLAVVVKAQQGNLTVTYWLLLIPSLAIYTFSNLWGIPKLGRWFFRKFGHDEGAAFLFVLVAFFVASYLAKLIEIEPIIGAFLAGVAITPLIPQLSPLMNRIQFIGNTLFVPCFLISVGMLVDPLILVKEPRSLLIAAVMIFAEVLSKFLAAWGSGFILRWQFPSTMVTFGLSVAQAASTLAAITVAYEIKLVDDLTVNGIIAMILVSCVGSPWITARWGGQVNLATDASSATGLPSAVNPTEPSFAERVLVPVANPNTEDNLLHLAMILAKKSKGTLLPLHILLEDGGVVSIAAKMRQRNLLEAAEKIAHAATTAVETIGRIDESIDKGIVRAAIEHDASLVICGWKGFSTARENFFGGVIDKVVRRAPMPVLIARFSEPIQNTKRVFVAVNEGGTSAQIFQRTLFLAKTVAGELKSSLQVMLVTGYQERPHLDVDEITGLKSEVSVLRVQGEFRRKVSEVVKRGDLLVLASASQPEFLGVSALGVAPEAISRAHPDVTIIVVNFPSVF